MAPTSFKICPDCGAEFRPTVAECSDCGCALVHPEEVPAEPGESPGAADPSPVRVACLARGGAWELRELAEALGQRGVSTRIGPFPPPGAESEADEGLAGFGPGLGIYVEEGDLERAATLHEQIVREWSHAEPETADGSGSADTCPACGHDLDPQAETCTSCGLEFPPLQG